MFCDGFDQSSHLLQLLDEYLHQGVDFGGMDAVLAEEVCRNSSVTEMSQFRAVQSGRKKRK